MRSIIEVVAIMLFLLGLPAALWASDPGKLRPDPPTITRFWGLPVMTGPHAHDWRTAARIILGDPDHDDR